MPRTIETHSRQSLFYGLFQNFNHFWRGGGDAIFFLSMFKKFRFFEKKGPRQKPAGNTLSCVDSNKTEKKTNILHSPLPVFFFVTNICYAMLYYIQYVLLGPLQKHSNLNNEAISKPKRKKTKHMNPYYRTARSSLQ